MNLVAIIHVHVDMYMCIRMLIICTGKNNFHSGLDLPTMKRDKAREEGLVKLVHVLCTLEFVGPESDWLTDDWNVTAHISNTKSLCTSQLPCYSISYNFSQLRYPMVKLEQVEATREFVKHQDISLC